MQNIDIMEYKKITVKEILTDKYQDFKNKYWSKVPRNMREHIDNTVKKALQCGDIKKGFAEYVCPKCGKLYTMKWAEKQQKNMLRVGYRHSAFTMPDELRNFFYSREELLKELQVGVYARKNNRELRRKSIDV